jgi:cytochrome c2
MRPTPGERRVTKIALLMSVLAIASAGSGVANAADAAAGARTFALTCGGCHSAQSAAKAGPALGGVVGRKAGSLTGFHYSKAMAAYGKTWTPATLSVFLTNPQAAVPGTSMMVLGVRDETARANLIAYLATLK